MGIRNSTLQAITTLLDADGGCSDDVRRQVVALLSGRRENSAPVDALMHRDAVAAALGVTTRTVDKYAERGELRRVYSRKGRYALGISRQSYLDLIDGVSNRARAGPDAAEAKRERVQAKRKTKSNKPKRKGKFHERRNETRR